MTESAPDKSLVLAWHESLWQRFSAALAADRVPHALLITGPRGVGKGRFAARIAAALLCHNRGSGGEACGACQSCRQRLALIHPDLSILIPEDDSRVIKIDQIRQFSHAMRLTPHYDTGRMGWIKPADALSNSASNSLLKTLEEPTPGSHLILISERPSKLLPTIRSRCQHWPVPSAPADVARAWLDGLNVDSKGIRDDRLRTPLAVLAQEQAETSQLFSEWDKDLARLLHRRIDPVSVAERAAEVADRQLWIEWLYRRCNDLLCASFGLPVGNGKVQAKLAEGAVHLGRRRLEAWSREVAEVARRVDSNANWQLVVEAIFIELERHIRAAGR